MEWSAERRQLVAVLDSYGWLPECGGHRCSSDELLYYSQGLRRSLEKRRVAREAKRAYGGAVASLIKYCTEAQLAAGLPPLSYAPASQATLIGWIAWMLEGDSVHYSSLKVYTCVVNQFHTDNGFHRPCADPEVHPTPNTLHPTTNTQHPTPYTQHPTPYILHPTPYTLHRCSSRASASGPSRPNAEDSSWREAVCRCLRPRLYRERRAQRTAGAATVMARR